MMGMARPQFTLQRLMLAVTCVAVSLGSFSLLHRLDNGKRWLFEFPLAMAFLFCPVLAVGCIAGRVGFAVSLVALVLLLLFA